MNVSDNRNSFMKIDWKLSRWEEWPWKDHMILVVVGRNSTRRPRDRPSPTLDSPLIPHSPLTGTCMNVIIQGLLIMHDYHSPCCWAEYLFFAVHLTPWNNVGLLFEYVIFIEIFTCHLFKMHDVKIWCIYILFLDFFIGRWDKSMSI